MGARRIPLLAAALTLAVSGPAAASPSQLSIFEAPLEMADDTLRAPTLDEVAAFGVRHVRVLVTWRDVAPAADDPRPPQGFDGRDPDDGGYNWTRYDAIFADANARGIEVIPTLTGPVPRWATANRRGHLFKPDRTQFAHFAEAVGRRYGARVNTWTIWNEPNQPTFLAPQRERGRPYSPLLYRALYQGALQGLSASGNGDDRILAGETAPFGGSSIVPPITFARLFFKGRRLDVDGWAHHPYSTAEGPFYRPRSTAVTIGVLPRLIRALDRFAPGPKLPLFLTEFGVQSKPDPVFGVGQQRQAEFRAIAERIAYETPRVAAISQYLMRDDQPGTGADRYGGFESGLRLADGTPKLGYEGYRMPLTATRAGRRVKLWGLIRERRQRQVVTLMQRDGGGKWSVLRRVRSDRRGYYTATARYRRGREFRAGWNLNASPPTDVYRAP